MDALRETGKIALKIEKERRRGRRRKVRKSKTVQIKDITLEVPASAETGFKTKTKTRVSKTKVKGSVFRAGGGGGRSSRRGFAKVKAYKKTNLKHALHVLRIETERKLAPSPAKLIASDTSLTDEQIKENILKMFEIDRKKTQGRKQTNACMEIFCAYESEQLVRDYIDDLSKRFNTNVYAVFHNDENVPHVHIMISWRNRDNKAIAVHKGIFKELWQETIMRLQPSRECKFKKGEGTPSLPFWQIREKYLKSQGDYDAFMESMRKMRELFYFFEENVYNPLEGKPKWDAFMEYFLKSQGDFYNLTTSLVNASTGRPSFVGETPRNKFGALVEAFYNKYLPPPMPIKAPVIATPKIRKAIASPRMGKLTTKLTAMKPDDKVSFSDAYFEIVRKIEGLTGRFEHSGPQGETGPGPVLFADPEGHGKSVLSPSSGPRENQEGGVLPLSPSPGPRGKAVLPSSPFTGPRAVSAPISVLSEKRESTLPPSTKESTLSRPTEKETIPPPQRESTPSKPTMPGGVLSSRPPTGKKTVLPGRESTVRPSAPPPGFEDLLENKKDDDDDIAVFKRIKKATSDNVKRVRF
ncbi:MAG: hypothetical protein QW561_01575 [Candidatus Aenigmatarchaeota archaeon]